MNDLSLELKQLQSVSDEQLKEALRSNELSISENKFKLAFSSYGFTRWISGIPTDVLKQGAPPMPEAELDAVRRRSVFLFSAYCAFVYMRSEQLEGGLDKITESSALWPFRVFFRRGRKNDGGATTAQHIRNSLSHGTFELSDNLQMISFVDKQWDAEIATKDFVDGFCDEVLRFYFAAYEVGSEASTS